MKKLMQSHKKILTWNHAYIYEKSTHFILQYHREKYNHYIKIPSLSTYKAVFSIILAEKRVIIDLFDLFDPNPFSFAALTSRNFITIKRKCVQKSEKEKRKNEG